MAILPSTRQQLIEAIEKFDIEYRNQPEFSGFESNRSQKYALNYEGELYPPKMIIHLATGIERRSFNGGEESNSYLKKYGFEIETLESEKMNLSGGNSEQSSASYSSKGLDYYLSHKPQIILAGPPGTSKTWSATEYVETQMGGKRFENAENEDAENYWSIVQFHPSYGYEDFISGVKAETVNGNLTFEQKKGIFLKMAIAAKHNPDKKYFLIIDEINRGVLGRIFGELILTLEYRGLEVHLPDEDEPLNIPENLFLIGTMNTADRNIALVDHALRRRFLIVEMLPDKKQLNNYHDTKSNSNEIRTLTLKAFRITQKAFYKTETQEYDPDLNGYNMQDYAVGHTYFMADNNDQLSMNIKHQVIPLLGEYQREGVITKAAFEKVKDKLSNFI